MPLCGLTGAGSYAIASDGTNTRINAASGSEIKLLNNNTEVIQVQTAGIVAVSGKYYGSTGIAFASLPTAIAGLKTWCTDCVPATQPCTGSGNGAWAQTYSTAPSTYAWMCTADSLSVENGSNSGAFTQVTNANFDDNGDIDFQRTAGPPDVVTGLLRTHRFFWPAATCIAGVATNNGDDDPAVAEPTPACVAGTNTTKGVADYLDAADSALQLTYRVPSSFSTLDANIKWMSATTTNSVVWQIQTICVADAETDDPTFNAASTVTDAAKGTANQTNDASITGVTVTGCAAGELMHIRIRRDPAHASDNHAATARLIAVEFVFNRV